jgi:hypothetical protein
MSVQVEHKSFQSQFFKKVIQVPNRKIQKHLIFFILLKYLRRFNPLGSMFFNAKMQKNNIFLHFCIKKHVNLNPNFYEAHEFF